MRKLLFDETWMDKAACRGMSREIFFPKVYQSQQPAKLVCIRCPVKTMCLEFALAHPSLKGIWGNTNERERVKIRRSRKRREKELNESH